MLPLYALLSGSPGALAQAPAGSDVIATLTIERPRAELAAQLRTTQQLAALLPSDCTADWEHGAQPEGPARMTYRILSFKRRLTAKVREPLPDRAIELDHEGPKGFVTRFLLDEDGPERTTVTMTTYLEPPGWPFRSYFHDKVHPLWVACQQQALRNLEVAR